MAEKAPVFEKLCFPLIARFRVRRPKKRLDSKVVPCYMIARNQEEFKCRPRSEIGKKMCSRNLSEKITLGKMKS